MPYLPAGFYLVSTLAYILQRIFLSRAIGRWASRFLVAGGLLSGVSLVLQVVSEGALGRDGFFVAASCLFAAAYLVLDRRHPLPGGGIFFAAGALVLYGMAFAASDGLSPPMGGVWSLLHILFMSLAFAVFAVSFLVGLAFLFQEYKLKVHRPSFPAWFPPLEVMEVIQYKALTFGFLLLSLGILMGAVLSKVRDGLFVSGDQQQLAALMVWIVYALFLTIRIRARWRGRRGVALSVLGFAGVLLAFVGLRHGGP